MSEPIKLKLYRIRESRYAKEGETAPAQAYVAAETASEALRIFLLKFREVQDNSLYVDKQTEEFLTATQH